MAQEGFLEEVMFDLASGMQRSRGRVGSRRDRKHSKKAWRDVMQVYRADGGIPFGGLERPGSGTLRPELQKCSITAV